MRRTSTRQRPGGRRRDRRRRARRAAAAIAGAGLVATGLVAAPTPVGAAPPDSDTLVFVPSEGDLWSFRRNGIGSGEVVGATSIVLEGDFTTSPGTDVFAYNPGPKDDGVVKIVPSGAGGAVTTYVFKLVNGTYTPLVGDFDGNGLDDIIWYAPGAGVDTMYRFAGSVGGHASMPLTINGTYQPVVLDADDDGYDDVLWYAPGAAADSMWLFGPGASHTTKAVTINGTYQVRRGRFYNFESSPQDQLLFFNPSGPDSIWSFDDDADHTSKMLPNVDGAYRPLIGHFRSPSFDSLFWYRPGAGMDLLWWFSTFGSVIGFDSPPQVVGTYDTAVGDVDGNGRQDIVWEANGMASIWLFPDSEDGAITQTSTGTGVVPTKVAFGHTDPADL
jgi:hypothetical protein